VATPLEDLAPGAIGKAELRGTVWTARNADSRPLAKGERSRVLRVDGLMLLLRGE
jgi:membrane protein implicated in regulation of membrane protease activity